MGGRVTWAEFEPGQTRRQLQSGADAQSSDADTGSFPSPAMTDGKENDTGEQTANVQMI